MSSWIITKELTDFLTFVNSVNQFELTVRKVRFVKPIDESIFVVGLRFKDATFIKSFSDAVGFLVFVGNLFSDFSGSIFSLTKPLGLPLANFLFIFNFTD